MYRSSAMQIFSKALFCILFWTLFTTIGVSAEECDGEGSLRLVGWREVSAGRIEICRNREWGTICADSLDTPWSEKNAQVACRALGHSGALNSILQNTIPEDKRVSDESIPIHYSLVVCSGDQDSLLDCDMEETADGCTHQQDAAIVCRRGELVGHVRLMGDSRDEVGAVQLYYPPTGWTGICADPDHAPSWLRDNQAAEIVCRQLGYRGGSAYVDSISQSAIRTRSVVIDGCDANKNFDLSQCKTSTIEECSTEDVGWVQCVRDNNDWGNAGKLGSRREGVMQLEFYGRMGHICNTDWDDIDAEVACVEFDQDDSRTDYDTNPEGNYTNYISDLKPIWLEGVGCTTTVTHNDRGAAEAEVNENDIIDCDYSQEYPIGLTSCHFQSNSKRMRNIALVDCGTPTINAGVIAGIVIGAIFGCLFCVCYLLICCTYASDAWYKKRNPYSYPQSQRRSLWKDVLLCSWTRSRVSRCVRNIRIKLRPQRTEGEDSRPPRATVDSSRFSRATNSSMETSTAATHRRSFNTVSEGDTEMTAVSAISDVTSADSKTNPDAVLTTDAPPSYAESTKYDSYSTTV